MNDDRRKMLTEYIGEVWVEHDNPSQQIYVGKVCIDKSTLSNRTFSTRDDMMDLYQAIEKAGKWRNFLNWVFNDLEEPDRGDSYYSTASIAWLFCLCKRWVTWDLSGEGYEDRCKMVSEFWKEANHE